MLLRSLALTRARADGGTGKPLVLFIAGTGRSGSTLLARLLEDALDSVHVGELRYVWERGVGDDQLCECGRPFHDCAFWTRVLDSTYPEGPTATAERMLGLTRALDRLRHIPRNVLRARGVARDDTVSTYRDLLLPLYTALGSLPGRPVVIDSSKDPSYLFALAAMDALDLRVVHLVRDSRAVAYSWTREKVRPEIHWQQQLMATHKPVHSARQWMETNLAIESFRSCGPSPVRVRYEDFAADPSTSVADIIDALDLGWARTEAEAGAESAPPERHSFSGNPLRFDPRPVAVRADVAWRGGLPARDRRAVSLVTYPLLRFYRYPA